MKPALPRKTKWVEELERLDANRRNCAHCQEHSNPTVCAILAATGLEQYPRLFCCPLFKPSEKVIG